MGSLNSGSKDSWENDRVDSTVPVCLGDAMMTGLGCQPRDNGDMYSSSRPEWKIVIRDCSWNQPRRWWLVGVGGGREGHLLAPLAASRGLVSVPPRRSKGRGDSNVPPFVKGTALRQKSEKRHPGPCPCSQAVRGSELVLRCFCSVAHGLLTLLEKLILVKPWAKGLPSFING